MNIVFGVFAHVDAGKTTFSEQLLYQADAVRRVGRVDDGDSFFDIHPIEKQRGITIFSEQAVFPFGDHNFYLIDTPGHVDFSAEMERVLDVLDYAVLLISGTDGIQAHTRTIWQLLNQYGIPVFLFVNKLDREYTDYSAVVDLLKREFSNDILDCSDWRETISEELIAKAAEASDSVLDDYLDGTLTKEKLVSALSKQIRERQLFPCFGGSALYDLHIKEFLFSFAKFSNSDYIDEKGEFSGRVFKVRYDSQRERLVFMRILSGTLNVKEELVAGEKVNQIRVYHGKRHRLLDCAKAGEIVAVTGLKSVFAGACLGAKKSIRKGILAPALQAKVIYDHKIPDHVMTGIFRLLEEEEPALSCKWEESLKQLTVQIMGKVQLEILSSIIREQHDFDVSFDLPEVRYCETIQETVCGYGHFEPLRHYAEVALRLEPGEPGSGITFSSQCPVDRLASNYQNLIRTHVFERTHKGILIGADLTDIHIVLMDGISHIKHTEGGDFREAVYRAIRQGLRKASGQILEPYHRFLIQVPQNYIGRVLHDITKYSGEFTPPVTVGERVIVSGRAPVATMMNYSEELAVYTGGSGSVSFCFDGYDICHNREKVIEDKGYLPDADTEHPSSSVFCSKGTSFLVEWDLAEEYMHCLRR